MRERAVVSTPQPQLSGGMRSFSAATDETAIIPVWHSRQTQNTHPNLISTATDEWLATRKQTALLAHSLRSQSEMSPGATASAFSECSDRRHKLN